MNNNSVSDASWYGSYIGKRYKNFPNVMYVWGNDTNPCGHGSNATNCSQKDKIRAMAQAALAEDPTHLHTFHATVEYSSRDVLNPASDPWLTANATYTYQPVQVRSLEDYNHSPVMPFFLFESVYEGSSAASAIQARRQAYVAVLSGAAGHHYGNDPIWHMNGEPGDSSNTWKQHLGDEARADLPHIRALFETRAWQNLVPDQSHTVVVSGFGSTTGSDYVGAARTSDGATIIAYIPFRKQITVDRTEISGSTIRAWWFDPRNGDAQLIGTFPTTGTQGFTPPTNDDWVLVLDDASLNLAPPGSDISFFQLISGNLGVGQVSMSDQTGVLGTSGFDGSYTIMVPYGWSGTVTPSHPCYDFNPSTRNYTDVTENQPNQNYTATFNDAPICAVTAGVFRPSNGLLYLKNSNSTGFADVALNYGLGGDYPVVGDWDGDGDTTIGIYRNGSFYLRNSNTIGFAEAVFAFGQPGDQPIAGDWNGDGIDTIGVYRPSNGQFFLRNSNTAGSPHVSFFLGNPGDVGLAGDWDGDGMDTTGVFRPSNGVIFLKSTNDTGIADIALNYGLPGDKPVMGDWNNDGIDTIGIYRNGSFYLRDSNTNGFANIIFALGIPGDHPIAGNWDGQP
jgi:hypothetical protein